METKPARERKFETLFDGDEIDGKFYGLGDGVTDIDAATAHYLITTGRIAEIGDEEFAAKSADSKGSDAEADADAERLEAAHADFAAGRIPDDLIDPAAKPEDEDKLVARAALDKLAKSAGAEVKGSMTKAEVAQAIMASRAKAEAGNS